MVCNDSLFLYSGPVGDVPGRSGTGDISAEVGTDAPVPKRRAVVTRRLIPHTVDGGRRVTLTVPALERSRELLEQAYDNGIAVFRCVSF